MAGFILLRGSIPSITRDSGIIPIPREGAPFEEKADKVKLSGGFAER